MSYLTLRNACLLGLSAVFGGCAATQDSAPPQRTLAMDDMPSTAAPVAADRSQNQITFQIGSRSWNDELWDAADPSLALGIDYSTAAGGGFGWEAGGLAKIGTEGGDFAGAAAEIFGGLRHTFLRGKWRPYASAGATLVYAGVDDAAGNQISDNLDLSPGLYLRGGVQYDIDEAFFSASTCEP